MKVRNQRSNKISNSREFLKISFYKLIRLNVSQRKDINGKLSILLLLLLLSSSSSSSSSPQDSLCEVHRAKVQRNQYNITQMFLCLRTGQYRDYLRKPYLYTGNVKSSVEFPLGIILVSAFSNYLIGVTGNLRVFCDIRTS